MFRIKICGITNVVDAQAATAAGADAIGLNFFRKSRRFVEPDVAREIAAALPADVLKVGVFVNHEAADIERIAHDVGLDAIQLHGDEQPELIAALPQQFLILRAHRCGEDSFRKLADYLAAWRTAGRMPDALLLDADAGSEYGGSGQRADWELIASNRSVMNGIPLVLAGGLTPDCVAAAISTVRPAGVDVASGVEQQPGIKDRVRMAEFIAAAQRAFEKFC
jgi:phosphoribosylanthranilate isomerase